MVWSRLAALLPPAERVGRPYKYERRLVLEALVYLMHSDCGWQQLPARFPPWPTVYAQLRQWRKQGIWEQIWTGLDKPQPLDKLQL
jgi:transposase